MKFQIDSSVSLSNITEKINNFLKQMNIEKEKEIEILTLCSEILNNIFAYKDELIKIFDDVNSFCVEKFGIVFSDSK